MKIAILTITPNIGFGGMLQAYALQSIIKSLGHNVTILNYLHKPNIRTKFSFLLKSLKKMIVNGEYVKLSQQADYEYRAKNIKQFHERYLNLSKRISTNRDLRSYINENFDCVVVGSDQVWRPLYVNNIYDYYLNGVNSNILKISYAASFGVDKWEYNETQTKVCSKLISLFTYLSVREKSGINLIKEHYGSDLNISWDLDPTLLIPKENYCKIAGEKSDSENRRLFTYILDPNYMTEILTRKISEYTGHDIYKFNTKAENGMGAKLKDRVAPSVESWLAGFRDADFIVTDSFHGTVFSIIFNKPFVVYVNYERGAERFISLLSIFNLQYRMVTCFNDSLIKILNTSIEWNNINARINTLRDNTIIKLHKLLNKNNDTK